MSVRIRITILFASIVTVILILVCSSVYYFSYSNRLGNIKIRLTNWAITTGSLLSQSALFDQQLMLKIDASTTLAMKDKTVQAYDAANHRLYKYSDEPGDTIHFAKDILDKARKGSDVYFKLGNREGIAHAFMDSGHRVVMVAAAYDEEGKKKLEQLLLILLLSFAGGLLIAIAAGFLFSKKLLIPLRRIADEVNKISVQNLGGRIREGSGKDEWNYLSVTLNQLLSRLQESMEIHRRFISNASHELSTPLTSISSQLEVSLNRERDASEYRRIMHSIYQDVRQLSKLTQTLLEFARTSGDPGGLEIDLVRIDEILLALPGEMTKLNEHYAVVLTFEQLPDEEEKLLVFGNEELLFTAIKNIVINGCKYSEDHKTFIKLLYKDDIITILIRDQGIGMAQEEFDNIFQPFYRVNDNHMAHGFGLGLSLSKQIIKLHKGRISVDSEQGKGTLFTVDLPSVNRKML